MQNQEAFDIVSESISKPLAKAVKTLRVLGFDKYDALGFIARMVDFAYSGADERKRMLDEADEIIKTMKEKNNG